MPSHTTVKSLLWKSCKFHLPRDVNYFLGCFSFFPSSLLCRIWSIERGYGLNFFSSFVVTSFETSRHYVKPIGANSSMISSRIHCKASIPNTYSNPWTLSTSSPKTYSHCSICIQAASTATGSASTTCGRYNINDKFHNPKTFHAISNCSNTLSFNSPNSAIESSSWV